MNEFSHNPKIEIRGWGQRANSGPCRLARRRSRCADRAPFAALPDPGARSRCRGRLGEREPIEPSARSALPCRSRHRPSPRESGRGRGRVAERVVDPRSWARRGTECAQARGTYYPELRLTWGARETASRSRLKIRPGSSSMSERYSTRARWRSASPPGSMAFGPTVAPRVDCDFADHSGSNLPATHPTQKSACNHPA